jgi:acyl-CoA thioesterase YciA
MNKEVILRVIPQMKDANPRGDIFGGWLMSQLDLAGMLVGSHQFKTDFATIAVKEMLFKHPIFAFDEVSIYGEVSHVGNTSFTVSLEAFVKKLPDYVESIKVASAEIVYATITKPGVKNAEKIDA